MIDSLRFGAGVVLLIAGGAMLVMGLHWLAIMALDDEGWRKWLAIIAMVVVGVIAFAALHYFVIAPER